MAINLLVLFILYSCQQNGSKKKYSQHDTLHIPAFQQRDTTELMKWKKDSLGCKHIRTPQLFDKLFVENKMDYKNTNEFISFFGKPNNQEKFKDRFVFVYYYNSICSNGKINMNSDKSSIRISFNLENNYLEKDTRVE